MTPKKIKILYTIPNFDTAGSGKVVYDLIENIDTTIFEPEICCFHTRGKFMKEIEKLNVKIHIFPFAIAYRPFFSFPFRLLKIIQFFRKHHFDIIHSWHWSSDFSEPLAAKIACVPWVFTKKSMGWGNKAWKWRSALSTQIITINSDMKKFYANRMLKKVKPIPLGVNTNFYHPNNANQLSIAEKQLMKKDDFKVISVVNLIPVKGIEVLIRAINELNNLNLKLVIIGNDTGEYALKLKQLAKNNAAIFFLGKKTDVRYYHGMADLFVIPTLELGEGLPIAPLEAMATGKIVIGSNVSGVKDILKPFPQCIFKPNDVESLKKTITYVLNLDKEERSTLKEKMRSHVVANFSLENFVEKNYEVYKELVGFKP